MLLCGVAPGPVIRALQELEQAHMDQEEHKQLIAQKKQLNLQRRRDEQARYIAGVHQRLIERFKVLRKKVPPLCACAKVRLNSPPAHFARSLSAPALILL